MNKDKFKNDLMIGETSSIEFKRCGNEVEPDVYESICAFLNRFGGDVKYTQAHSELWYG